MLQLFPTNHQRQLPFAKAFSPRLAVDIPDCRRKALESGEESATTCQGCSLQVSEDDKRLFTNTA